VHILHARRGPADGLTGQLAKRSDLVGLHTFVITPGARLVTREAGVRLIVDARCARAW
jgi:hypothetical protein